MASVKFYLSVNVYEIFTKQLDAKSLTLKRKMKQKEENEISAIWLQKFESILVIFFRILAALQNV